MTTLVNCVENKNISWEKVFKSFENYKISNEIVKKNLILNLIFTEKGVEGQFYKNDQLYKVPLHWQQPAFLSRLKRGFLKKELFSKAINLKNKRPLVFDLTGGFGIDALMMARMGCQVAVFEQSPFLYDILCWNLNCGFNGEALEGFKSNIIKVILGDSSKKIFEYIELLKKPELIYLDPMFPEKKKKSLAPKEMQMLQFLLGHDDLEDNAQALLDVGLIVKPQKVILKRPLKSPVLIPKPTHQYLGKTIRYDIYS